MLKLGILGPLEVRIDDGPGLPLGGSRQRSLLAILALRAGQVVSTDRLVDELWGENPPATALHTVHVFVSRLRRALGEAGERLITRPPGYLLELDPDDLDASRCEREFEHAKAALAVGDATGAAARFAAALKMWRGPPLADFTYAPFAQAEIARLGELRISCREGMIEAEIALGHHAEVVPDLEAIVREHPFRERPHGQLMVALYRCGRQAAALEAYRQARRTMIEELGVEPGRDLRELEQKILDQDDSLAFEATKAPVPTQAERHAPTVPPDKRAASAPAGSPYPLHDSAALLPRAPSAPVMRRRTVTVLAARMLIKGYSDPERARRVIACARDEFERIVAQHGGTFVAGLGHVMIGLFGLPVTKEDDALRGLRAAHELHVQLRSTGAREPEGLGLHIGLDTGEVVAETPQDVFGAPLDRAAALAAIAPDGGILLTDTTRQLTDGKAVTEPSLDATTWRLLDLVTAPPVLHRRFDTPMFGRSDELVSACTFFAQGVKAGAPRLLTVLGDAGIGKSRFTQELIGRLGGGTSVLAGRCLPYGEGVTFWPLREAITSLAGGQSEDAIRGLLGGQRDADALAGTIATSLGLTPGETTSDEVPWAIRRLLEELARHSPVLLIIEDAHWAEPPLLDLVDYLVDWLTGPVLILCPARPELLEERPGWGGGRERVNSLVLGPLADEHARALLEHRLGHQQLTAEEIAEILSTAEGNPLFVEQLLAIVEESPGWTREHPLPGSVQALLAARVDRLGPAERAFIERAAIIGREFWPAAVMDLLPAEARPSVEEHVRSLVRRGLIHPDRSTMAGEEQLRFHHILIRDVAYRGTPKMLRAELHERFALWLSHREASYDEFLGYHFQQAFRYRAELDGINDESLALAARAAECLGSAGRRSLSRGDPAAAVKQLEVARELFEAGDHKRPGVLLCLGRALSETGKFAEAEVVLEAAVDLATESNADAMIARAQVELSYSRGHLDRTVRVEEMQSVAEQAVQVFERFGDHAGLSRAWLHIALAHWIRSDCQAMEVALECALVHAEQSDERGDRSRILSDLARTTVFGRIPVERGIDRCGSILARADGDHAATAFTEAMLAILEAMDGRFDDARARWRQGQRRLAEMGLTVSVAVAQMYYGFVELLSGEPDRAEPEVADACKVFERIGSRGHLSSAAAMGARLMYDLCRYDDCERYCEISRNAVHDDDVVSQVLWRGTQARLLARGGDALAEAMVDDAVARADATDFLMLRADARADHAEVLRLLDRPAEAAEVLEQADLFYREKGIRRATAAARRTRARLTESSAA